MKPEQDKYRTLQRDAEDLQMACLRMREANPLALDVLREKVIFWRVVAVLGWVFVFLMGALAVRGAELSPRMDPDGPGFKKPICPVPVLAGGSMPETQRASCIPVANRTKARGARTVIGEPSPGWSKPPGRPGLAAGQNISAAGLPLTARHQRSCGGPSKTLITENFLDAMEQVESGMDARAVGDQGRSRGSFQFKAVAWSQVNSLRAARGLAGVDYLRGCTSRVTARLYAVEYLRWLESNLAAALRRSPSRPELYAAWNLGPSGFRARGFLLAKCPARVRDAGQRVENLAGRFNAERGTGSAE